MMKGTKRCVLKNNIMYESYKDCLFHNKTTLKKKQRFKNDHHKVYAEEVITTFNRITKYPYGTNEMMIQKP